VLSFSFLLSYAAPAQPPAVSQRNRRERILVAGPMVGSGTYSDPKRPLFAPAGPGSANPFLGFSYVMSDDGRFAIVEFVARDRAALAPILSDRIHNLQVFEKGKHGRDEIEREFRKLKKDFTLEKLGGAEAVGGEK
jgi:hypothetical protein